MHPLVQSHSAANGFGRRSTEKDGRESSSQDRIVYFETCLIGHPVEVKVVDGSNFSGILHVFKADKDLGIILRMGRLTKIGSRGQSMSDLEQKPPLKTLIIPAEDIVEIKAKGVPLTREGLSNELHSGKQQELLVDSYISQSKRTDLGRPLQRWVPEDDDPMCTELENTFDGSSGRGWDQFHVNETLFGVKSTYEEELYTTKLIKGPQTKELESKALRIAKEIEGEATHDIHLAEERGLKLHGKFEIDEESRYSSVLRVGVDDSGYDDKEDILLDTRNNETFGGGSIGSLQSFPGSGKLNDGAQGSTIYSPMREGFASPSVISREVHQSGADDARQLTAGHSSKDSATAGDIRSHENQMADHAGTSFPEDTRNGVEEARTSTADDSRSSLWPKKESSDRDGLSANVTAYDSSHISSKSQEKASSSNDQLEGMAGSSKVTVTAQAVSSCVRPSSSTSSTSDCGGGGGDSSAVASVGPGLSPTSSMSLLTPEKSTLNPHAKEFKLNPNAKSFVPSHPPLRPASPAADTSFYYTPAAVPPFPVIGLECFPTTWYSKLMVPTVSYGKPVGTSPQTAFFKILILYLQVTISSTASNLQAGVRPLHSWILMVLLIGPAFMAHQPIIYNPQVAPAPQPYFHPGGPQYGPQMMVGHPQQGFYMPATYPPETPYRRR